MDGTPLRPDIVTEQSTLVREPRVPQKQAYLSGKLPLLGCSVIGLLLLIGLGVAGAYLYFFRDTPKAPANQANVSNVNQDAINKQMANLQQQQADIDKQKQQLANEQKKLENQNTKPPANITIPAATDPPTARITFHRGSVQETVTGTVVKKRSYVLRTLSGQTLSASIRSGGSCVAFSNGSASLTYETEQGDSNLTVINNCASPANFNMTVFIR
jgi:cytoskeletal protein RodZ